MLEKNGIVTISAPWSTAAMVENYLDRPGIAQFFEIGTGVAGLVGITVTENSQLEGKLIRNIVIPKECVVAAIIRGKEFVVPRGDTQFQIEDRVIFIGPDAAIKGAQDIFLLSK